MANAAIAPTKAPKMAKPTFWVVNENAIPAMLIVWREPIARASCVAKSERRKLGTTIPAMNKVNTTSIRSRTSERAFCLFMFFPSSLSADFPKGNNPFCSDIQTRTALRRWQSSPLRFPHGSCGGEIKLKRMDWQQYSLFMQLNPRLLQEASLFASVQVRTLFSPNRSFRGGSTDRRVSSCFVGKV
jgi:hypothetical protein